MRADKNNNGQIYHDFFDWLRAGWNLVWVLSFGIGYLYYLLTTEEV